MLKDPSSEGSEADIAAQVAMLHGLQVDLVAAVSVVEQIEWVRRQLADLTEAMEAQGQSDVVGAKALLSPRNLNLPPRLPWSPRPLVASLAGKYIGEIVTLGGRE